MINPKFHHLLSFDEEVFIEEHKFDKHAVAVRRLCKDVVDLEDALSAKRDQLEAAQQEMKDRMRKHGYE